MKTVYVMVGIPGSGKSTVIQSMQKDLKGSSITISRDAIRFSLLKEGERYFAKERQVFPKFIEECFNAIQDEFDHVFIDATHISPISRERLLRPLFDLIKLKEYKIVFQIINTPVEVCIERDKERAGRQHVGEQVIRDMFKNFNPPDEEELDYYNAIAVEVIG